MSEIYMPPGPTLTVARWVDPLVDNHARSMPVRSVETELFWLPIVGPTALLAARRLDIWLSQSERIVVGIEAMATMLGVRGTSRHAPLSRSLNRLCGFRLARWEGEEYHLRTTWAPLTERQVGRLPEALAAAYRTVAAA